MKLKGKICVFLVLLYLCASLHAAEVDEPGKESQWFVPEGVVYVTAETKHNEKAKQQLMAAFVKAEQKLYPLSKKYSGYLFLGPLLSSRIRSTDPQQVAQLRSAGYQVKLTEDFTPEFKGVVAKTNAEKKILSHLLSDRWGTNEDLKVRRLTPEELAFMWFFISWDIKEPVYVVQGKKHNWLVDVGALTEDDIWIEELNDPCVRMGFEQHISPCFCFDVNMNGRQWSAGFVEQPQLCDDSDAEVTSQEGGWLVYEPEVPQESNQPVSLNSMQLLTQEWIIGQNFTAEEIASWVEQVGKQLNQNVKAGQNGQIAIEIHWNLDADSSYEVMYQGHIDTNWLQQITDVLAATEPLQPVSDDIAFVMVFDVRTESPKQEP